MVDLPRVIGAVLVLLGLFVGADYLVRTQLMGSSGQFLKGREALRAGEFDNAISSFKRELAANKDEANSRFGLAWAYHQKGNKEEAAKQYQLAIKSAGTVMEDSYYNLGVLLHKSKQLQKAGLAYRSVLLVNPDSARASFNYGFILKELGKKKDALAMFKRTLNRQPNNVRALYQAGKVSEELGKKSDAIRFYQKTLKVDPNMKLAKQRLAALRSGKKKKVTKKKSRRKSKRRRR